MIASVRGEVTDIALDHAVIEAGEGIGDEEADLEAAAVVATALRNAGLTTTVELREGAAYVTVRGGTR